MQPETRPFRTRRRWVRPVVTVLALTATGFLLATLTAGAETTHVVALADSVDEVLTNIRNWLMGILALLATVLLTIGGVRYVLAAGAPSEVDKAKQAITNGCLGYALAALAPLIVEILKGIVGDA